MHVVVTGRNIDLTPSLKEYLNEKLQRAQKHFNHPLEVQALLSVAKNPSIAQNQTAEVTIKVNGNIIRGEESSENMYNSIDLVADKIERQLRKFKTRHWGRKKIIEKEPEIAIDVSPDVDTDEAVKKALATDDIKSRIVRSKRHPLKPMTPEEACAHMDLLGHDFFMFFNSETGQVNTVYHRRDGQYGLIEPEV
jgi:putative sigma-54 modulation protein